MSANKRFAVGVFWVSVISLFTFALPPSVASCDDSLAPLVADYRDYGLPEPSELAEFSLLKWSTGTTNGVPNYSKMLAFVETDSQDKQKYYWVGCGRVKLPDHFSVTPISPKAASLAETQPTYAVGQRGGFPRLPDVALAVQCGARGWEELGIAFLQRARSQPLAILRIKRKVNGVAIRSVD